MPRKPKNETFNIELKKPDKFDLNLNSKQRNYYVKINSSLMLDAEFNGLSSNAKIVLIRVALDTNMSKTRNISVQSRDYSALICSSLCTLKRTLNELKINGFIDLTQPNTANIEYSNSIVEQEYSKAKTIINYNAITTLYNNIISTQVPKALVCKKLSQSRIDSIDYLTKNHLEDAKAWKQYFEQAAQQAFIKNNSGQRSGNITIDTFLKEEIYIKVIEGMYQSDIEAFTQNWNDNESL